MDNIHLYERFARDIFNHWQQVSNNSRLLLVGRHVVLGLDARGRSRPLNDLDSEARMLRAGPSELAGVFQRLVRRASSERTIISPPEPVLVNWSVLFSGDLIAFSAAVAGRVDSLLKGDWSLRPEDAKAYVRETYWDPLIEAEERRDLIHVSVLAILEGDTTRKALESGKLIHSLRTGLIHRVERGQAKHVWFHLIHPGMGKLLLAATEMPVDELMILKNIAYRDPFCGTGVASRLETCGRQQDAATVLETIVAEPQGLLTLITNTGRFYPNSAQPNLSRLVRLNVLTDEAIDQQLATRSDVLVDTALRTPLHFLAAFLKYAQKTLPQVYSALSTSLTKPESLDTLAKVALCTPLDGLAAFLEYAQRALPIVYFTLSTALAKPENLDTLAKTALHTPLNALAAFLEYAEYNLNAIAAEINGRLLQPAATALLAQAMCRSPLDGLVKFLTTGEAAQSAFNNIDREVWDRSRLSEPPLQPSAFSHLASLSKQLGRPELAEAPACRLIKAAVAESWHAPGIVFHHVSNALRLGRAAGSHAITQFLERVVTATWLETSTRWHRLGL